MDKRKKIALDGESYFSRPEYSLSRMSSDRYIRDDRFQLQCLAVYSDTMQARVSRDEIPQFLARLDPETEVIAQHAQFDGAYLWHCYKWRPKFWYDTLSMSRALHGLSVKHSLDALCHRYGLPPKAVRYEGFEGKRYENMDAQTRQNQMDDCLGDAWRTWELGEVLIPCMPKEELAVIDMTVRMFTEPVLYGDQLILNAIIKEEKLCRGELLAALGITKETLTSDDKFESLLLGHGIMPDYKEAKNKRGKKGCFSVSDDYFKQMLESTDPNIRELFAARAYVKSTIQRTRAETLCEMAKSGPLRVYYYYYGARNARFSGGEGTNFQNLPARGHNGTRLRQAVQAPEGCVLVVPDLSQIECRMLVTCANEDDKIQAFREGRDLYREAAAATFGVPLDAVTELQRQCGKVQVLQLGYNAGWRTYQASVKRLTGVDLGENLSRTHVSLYRLDNEKVCRYWEFGETALKKLSDNTEHFDGGVWRGSGQTIILPNELKLHFNGLHWGEVPDPKKDAPDNTKMAWKLPALSGYTTFYGGKLIQNINSALARIVLTQAQLRVIGRFPWCKVAIHTHDDCGFVCAEDRGEELKAIVDEEFTRPPVWLPNIPLAVKTQIRRDYAK